MTDTIQITSAQHSDAGRKEGNEDACGIHIPHGNTLTTKGAVAVIADGMSASEAGREASHACVQGFLSDYFSTPESWTVKTAGRKVLTALNRWLHGQGQQLYGTPKGMVTTLSVLVMKSTTAYLFHVGDTRIYRVRNNKLERLTRDHRLHLDNEKNYLSRAMGIDLHIEIDYKATSMQQGDIYLLTTDGIHDFLKDNEIHQILLEYNNDFEQACSMMVDKAIEFGSYDNLTCQVLRIDALPEQDQDALYHRLTELPFPPPLSPGMRIDGYQILRELHASKRSELFLALDEENGDTVVLKAPSVNYEDDPTYIDLFLHEEWVGKRIENNHVAKLVSHKRQKQFLYTVSEYIDGQTLGQWMTDHPRPTLAEVRDIINQVGMGLQAFHRKEMIHQDIKPENVMLDKYGTVKIIDFGSTKIAGIEEITTPIERPLLLGTVNYTAPEYLLGYQSSSRSDIFSLGTITYEMLTGKLPYGKALSDRYQRKLTYRPATHYNPEIPAWVDGALRTAVHPDPAKRYSDLSEFIYDLSHPNPQFISDRPLPLVQRYPVGFWRSLALLLLACNLGLIIYLLMQA